MSRKPRTIAVGADNTGYALKEDPGPKMGRSEGRRQLAGGAERRWLFGDGAG